MTVVAIDTSDDRLVDALAALALTLDVRHQSPTQGAAAGFLTLPPTFDADMLKKMANLPSVAALDDKGGPVGFMLASTADPAVQSPIVKGALECLERSAYAGLSLAVYGPVGVAGSQQGRGLAQTMFEELARLLKNAGREVMLAFVDQSNKASMGLHVGKLGFVVVGDYEINGKRYAAIVRELRT